MELLADATTELFASLDYDATLKRVAGLATQTVAEWCTVDIVEADGTLQRVETSAAESDARDLVPDRLRSSAPSLDSSSPIVRVLRTGEAELVSVTSDEFLARAARDADHLARMRAIGELTVMIVPLAARGRTIGVITLTSRAARCRFGEEDLIFAEELSRRAALAVDNARLYHSAQAELAERQRMEAALRQSEASYRMMFENNPFPMYVYDPASLGFLAVNEAMALHYGWSAAEFMDLSLRDIRPAEELPRLDQAMREHGVPGGAYFHGEFRHRRKDGMPIDVEVTSHDLTFAGRLARLVRVTDLTERRRLEQQLQQAQRIEAIGRLAGGIAHDFNNALTAIRGFSDMALDALPTESPVRDDLLQVRRPAEHAATLTRQLLAFGRRQVLQPRDLDLNEVVADMEKMLRRLIGADVRMETRREPLLRRVRVDPGQLEQVIVNLAVNARDAMPTGGTICISTSNTAVTEAFARRHPGMTAGAHVLLAVSDTGHGMDAATLERIFEPFFTTKPRGKGTGLGLATVYGIVRQSGGTVVARSESGRGTVFEVYLPVVGDGAQANEK